MRFKTLGFPIIRNFPGDIREFTPGLFKQLNKFDQELILETGYGSRLGFTEKDYLDVCPRIKFADRETVFHQDMLVTLKNPELEDLETLNDGSALFTMIHYGTRPRCVSLIQRKKLESFSMDALVDDQGLRTFVDYFGTAFAACETGFEVFKQTRKDFNDPERKPYVATVVGAGGVAQNCVRSFEILSDRELYAKKLPGLITQVITRSITMDPGNLKEVLKKTDILVDATKRPRSDFYILTNEAIGYLPEDAIIIDVAADPYDPTQTPMQVKAFEGTVKGTNSQKVFYPDDPEYDKIPAGIETKNRRINVSCDAWPSIHPLESITYYEPIMMNYLNILLTKDTKDIDGESSNVFERSLYRSTISYFEEKHKK